MGEGEGEKESMKKKALFGIVALAVVTLCLLYICYERHRPKRVCLDPLFRKKSLAYAALRRGFTVGSNGIS